MRNPKAWIPYAIGSLIFFTFRGVASANLAQRGGPVCLFYYAIGPVITSLIYFIIEATRNVMKPGG